jgi:type IV pilus assembly protein PilP
MKLIALTLPALAALLAACGGSDVIQPGQGVVAASGTPAAAASGNAPKPAASAAAAASPTANMPPLPKRVFEERDFAESDINRDPFRSFAADLVAQSKIRQVIQRKVIVDRYALEELKLVGLVTGNPSRALLIDPTGLGWVAKVGDYVGKPEMVHTGGPTGTDVPINWRVDRIRGSDVVFIREDPSHPEIPPTTRVIALRALEEGTGPKTAGITAANKDQ